MLFMRSAMSQMAVAGKRSNPMRQTLSKQSANTTRKQLLSWEHQPGHSLERMERQMKLQTAQSRDIRISCTPCISTQVSGHTMNIFRQRLLMQERRSFRSLYLSLVYHRPVATEPLTRHPQTNG